MNIKFYLLGLILLLSGCAATSVKGTIVRAGYETHKKQWYPYIVVGNKKYRFAASVDYSINTNKKHTATSNYILDRILPFSQNSIYSVYTYYPPQIELFFDKSKQVYKAEIEYKTLSGHIKEYNIQEEKLIIVQSQKSNQKTSLENELDFYVNDIPNGDLWQIQNTNKIQIYLDRRTAIYYNFRPINKQRLEEIYNKNKWLKIHIVKGIDGKLLSVNVFNFQKKVELYTDGYAGLLIYYDPVNRRFAVWQTKTPLLFENGEIFKIYQIPQHYIFDKAVSFLFTRIEAEINHNKLRKVFVPKLDYVFADNALMIIGGQKYNIFEYFKTTLNVSPVLFNGPAYLNFDSNGEIVELVIPYIYAR